LRDHTEIEQLLSIRALDALDGDDEVRLRDLMGSHGDCDECRELERGTNEVTARLAESLAPVAVPPSLEERTVTLARATRGPTIVDEPATEGQDHDLDADRAELAAAEDAGEPAGGARPPRRRSRRRGPAWIPFQAVAGVAAAVVLFVGGWFAGLSSSPQPQFTLRNSRLATFSGSGPIRTERLVPHLILVYRMDARGMMLVGDGFGMPTAGTTYELWLFRGTTPVRAGCFHPTSAGDVLRWINLSIGTSRMLTVTEEPTTCPRKPTSEPVLTVRLPPSPG
jgi:hypothetical protein